MRHPGGVCEQTDIRRVRHEYIFKHYTLLSKVRRVSTPDVGFDVSVETCSTFRKIEGIVSKHCFDALSVCLCVCVCVCVCARVCI